MKKLNVVEPSSLIDFKKSHWEPKAYIFNKIFFCYSIVNRTWMIVSVTKLKFSGPSWQSVQTMEMTLKD